MGPCPIARTSKEKFLENMLMWTKTSVSEKKLDTSEQRFTTSEEKSLAL